ncbi:MAG: filamentous hemagglutinin N-terminal domain-containing protein [Leptolyngbyaceae cyanobacterium SL_7_1]|nr:filamentous hemagglutinin N-terminal domain-containing protein [Leptolyngbyaceae cyanobacterium SL_7_1]
MVIAEWARAVIGLTAGAIVLAIAPITDAQQITPDNTLSTRSRFRQGGVTIDGQAADSIDQGLRSGSNLFHSFSEFNIDDGQRVYFANPAGVENILTRVTGTSRSDILGTLGVTGSANLFLLNPNGILLGENADWICRGGSFIASTANEIRSNETSFFSATEPNANPTLRVDRSAFLFSQVTPGNAHGSIINRSQAPSLTTTDFIDGLTVPNGESLFLIGGDVVLDGGYMRAPGGRVELAGLAGEGFVELEVDRATGEFQLDFERTYRREFPLANVTLDNGAVVDVTGAGGGDVFVNAADINVLATSNVCAGIGASSFCGAEEGGAIGSTGSRAGNILFIATNDVVVDGAGTRIGNNVNVGATGTNADIYRAIAAIDPDADTNDAIDVLFGSIIIAAGDDFITSGGAQITTSTLGSGSSGVVFIPANRVTVTGTGTNPDGSSIPSGLFSSVLDSGRGRAGGVLVQARTRFTLSDNAVLLSNTLGTGDAGRVVVQAGTSISLSNGAEIRSATFANGRAGFVSLQAPNVQLSSSLLSSSAFENAQGNAGGVFVQAGTATLENSSINSNTFGRRNAGGVLVQTSGDLILNNSTISSESRVGATGVGGAILITTGGLLVAANNSFITTSAADSEAGGIFASVRGPVIVRGGSGIASLTLAGDGGDVLISDTNFIVLASGSNLTAEAGRSGEGGVTPVEGDGGNIILDVGALILSTPPNDSNIIADANGGDGGNITIVRPINLQDIAERPNVPQTNDISASSEFGNEGFISVNELDVDPVRGLVELPTSLVDVSSLAVQGCPQLGGATAGQLGELYITGRGGIPPGATEPRSAEAVIAGWVESPDSSTEATAESEAVTVAPESVAPESVPEAIEFTHWQVDDNGDILLLAHNSTPVAPVNPVCP